MALRKLRLPMVGRVAEIQIARAPFDLVGAAVPEKNTSGQPQGVAPTSSFAKAL